MPGPGYKAKKKGGQGVVKKGSGRSLGSGKSATRTAPSGGGYNYEATDRSSTPRTPTVRSSPSPSPKKSRTPKPKVSKPRKSAGTPNTTPDGFESVVKRLKQKYDPDGRTKGESSLREGMEANRREAKIENAALSQIDNPTPKQEQRVRANTNLTANQKKVDTFRGKKVKGKQSAREVATAARQGKLKKGKGGNLTTPAVRSTRKQVKRATKKLKKARKNATERIDIAGEEGVFVNTLAKKTGLSPKVVAAWTRAEGGNSTQDWNRLNIGHTDSGPIGLTADGGWSDPKQAAKLSAAFLKGEYGGPSQAIQNILPASEGASDAQQIQNIAGSGWATNPDYLSLINAVYGDVNEPVTKANTKQLKQATELAEDINEDAERLGIQGVKGLSQEGKRKTAEVFVTRKRKGPYAGSQRMVSKILGQPVWGDKEEGHSASGDHDPSQPMSYAQDIGSSGGNPEEGEQGLGYDENTLDEIERNLRQMGADVPDLSIGQNWDGNVQGYQIQLITEVHGSGPHVHLGARWTGETPPPGTVAGSVSGGNPNGWATTSGGPNGSVRSAASPSAMAGQGPAQRDSRRDTVLNQLKELGYKVTPEGVKNTRDTAAAQPEESSLIESLQKKYD